MGKIKTKKIIIVGIAISLGLLGGFLYWKYIGCTSGSCPITANWHTSTLMGGIFGYLIGDSVHTKSTRAMKS